MIEGCTRAMLLAALLREMGVDVGLDVFTDSSAAKYFASRRGLNKMRHLHTKHLWLQEKVAKGEVKLHKIAGIVNPADILTKYHCNENLEHQLEKVNVVINIAAD